MPSKCVSPTLNPDLNPAAKEFEPNSEPSCRTKTPSGSPSGFNRHLHGTQRIGELARLENYRGRTGSCPNVSWNKKMVSKGGLAKQVTKKPLMGDRPKPAQTIDVQTKMFFPAKILVPTAYSVLAPVMLHSNVFFVQPFILQNQALLKRSLLP